MMRKKKRQSEREADAAQKDHIQQRDEPNANRLEVDEPGAGPIDLNCRPNGEEMQVDITGLSP